MIFFYIQIILIAILTACCCVIPGTFLVLRGVALMSDAMSHAVLPGIVLMFLLTRSLSSPLLFLGAAMTAFLTVIGTEQLIHSKKLKQDAAVGLVFPFLFSIGVLLISIYARSVHLDTDMVFAGEIAFAPLDQLYIGIIPCGARALWHLFFLLILNGLFVRLFFKELQLTIFDPTSARLFGYNDIFIHYALMALTSITTVIAFDTVGAIVVVSLMIVPASAALLFSRSLHQMLKFGLLYAVGTGIIGSIVALYADISIAGCIATTAGALFFITFWVKRVLRR